MKRRIWQFITISGFISILLSGTALAQNPTPEPGSITDDQVNAVAKQLYCPVCENTPLDVCPTQACAEWRELIREQLSEGWSEKQIKDYFVTRYGARVLATPPVSGLNWLIYIIPPILILLGLYFVYLAFKSWKTTSRKDSGGMTQEGLQADQSYIDRLEDELRKF